MAESETTNATDELSYQKKVLLMIELSCKAGMRNFIFEANDSNTWNSVTSFLSVQLTEFWKHKILAGSSPADAFNVSCGLGSTMTAKDILEGLMIVKVQVAITTPRQFTTFVIKQHQQPGQ